MKKVINYISIIGFLLAIHLYLYKSENIQKIDYKLYDLTNTFFNLLEKDACSYTVIIDIDENSLRYLGQWPWPRIIEARLIDKINKMNPSAIGVNILFPERDRVSLISIEKFYQDFLDIKIPLNLVPENIKDNDRVLANSIKKSNATLSTYFNNNHKFTAKHCQELMYKENIFSSIQTNYKASSLLCNYKKIQEGTKNFGFINASVDSDGTFRRMPLFTSYNKHIFPSFALATILSFDENFQINQKNTNILVDFSKTPKVFSAIDILKNNVPSSEIQGKVILIGSSFVGLNPTYIIANGTQVSNNMIHASVIDSILGDSLLTQPLIYKKINIFISFLFSLLVLFFLHKKLYIFFVFFLISIILLSFLWLIDSYSNGIYISLAYLWTPLFLLLLSLLAYSLNLLKNEKKKQEIFLIKQSKLASMGEMISVIAHQWRQPLSSINGIVLNIDIDNRREVLHNEKLDNYLNEIEETTSYLSNTINDFTEFFSTNKRKEVFYISEVISQAIHLTGMSNKTQPNIHNQSQEEIEIKSYKSELIQTLLILLNNAIYACQKNNLSSKEETHITIKTYSQKEYLYILVEDNGGGIDTQNLNKIFNSYFTTKDKAHGTGLGLYILKLIVEESMSGKVSVKNGLKGAIFTMKIPKE